MASFTGLPFKWPWLSAGVPRSPPSASHPSWLDWVLYTAFSGQCFKSEEAARPLEGWALELIQWRFCQCSIGENKLWDQPRFKAQKQTPHFDGSCCQIL